MRKEFSERFFHSRVNVPFEGLVQRSFDDVLEAVKGRELRACDGGDDTPSRGATDDRGGAEVAVEVHGVHDSEVEGHQPTTAGESKGSRSDRV